MISKIFAENEQELLIVEIPNDVTWWRFHDCNELDLKNLLKYGKSGRILGKDVDNIEYYNSKTYYCCTKYDNVKIVGKLSEIDLSEYVDSFIGKYSGKVYLDYNADINFLFELKTSYESFISLCKSQGVQIDDSKEYLIIEIIK